MAKVVVVGDAVVVKSAAKLDDLKIIAKYRESALVLKGGEDNKEDIFAVGITNSSKGTLNKYGASFASHTNDADGFATITLGIAGDIPTDKLKETIADKYGEAIIHLTALEETFEDVLKGIEAQKEQVMQNITIA